MNISQTQTGGGDAARDEAIATVVENAPTDWKAEFRAMIDGLPWGWGGTGEDLRLQFEAASPLRPQHPNAWGGVVNGAVRSGVLQGTGRFTKMKATSSHSRKTEIYRKV